MPTWPSPRSERLGTPKFPQSASRGASLSGLPGLLTLRPTRLLAPLCRIEPASRPQRAFTSRLPADWSPALPLKMTTTWTGLLVLAGLSPAGMAASLAAPDPDWRNSRIRFFTREIRSRRYIRGQSGLEAVDGVSGVR